MSNNQNQVIIIDIQYDISLIIQYSLKIEFGILFSDGNSVTKSVGLDLCSHIRILSGTFHRNDLCFYDLIIYDLQSTLGELFYIA